MGPETILTTMASVVMDEAHPGTSRTEIFLFFFLNLSSLFFQMGLGSSKEGVTVVLLVMAEGDEENDDDEGDSWWPWQLTTMHWR